VELVSELGRLMECGGDETQEDIDRQQRLHLHLLRRNDYPQFLQLSLQQARQGTEVDVLVCA
jgi:hypothetical protein